jgi:hypothetical protein
MFVWTEDEDRKLFELFARFGTKWCEIVKHFPNKYAYYKKVVTHSSRIDSTPSLVKVLERCANFPARKLLL